MTAFAKRALNAQLTYTRRPRYSGKNPRRFEQKYKELAPDKYPETVAKVLAAGKTPAGSHVPILVDEILQVLRPQPGETAADCTLGHGCHAAEILRRILPGGRLLGLDIDPLELPRTEARLRALGFGSDAFQVKKSNFAGLPGALSSAGWGKADCILADLGVSSMQLDTPKRGFSMKIPGPLDMRMNPHRGISAAELLKKISPKALEVLLLENADDPRAGILSAALAGREFVLTTDLSEAIRSTLDAISEEDQDKCIRRVFQGIRIAINDELSALSSLLRVLPQCLSPGGRAAILTFHSGEDRRVKKAFQAGLMAGVYSEVSDTIIRPTPQECRSNPRAGSAKLRWARATVQ